MRAKCGPYRKTLSRRSGRATLQGVVLVIRSEGGAVRTSSISSLRPGMALLALGLLAIGLVKLGPHPTLAHRPNSPATTVKVNKPQVVENYGKLPLSFEANQGQTDSRVDFLSRGSGYTLFLTPTEAVLALRKPGASSGQRRAHTPPANVEVEQAHAGQPAVLRMKLVGANPATQVVGLEELPGESNYFIGNDPDKWRTDVPHYAKVQYKDVYPGVDLIYYGNQRQLEYDLVVEPGPIRAASRLALMAWRSFGSMPRATWCSRPLAGRSANTGLSSIRTWTESGGKSGALTCSTAAARWALRWLRMMLAGPSSLIRC